jgi:hypothetical protein
MDRPSLTVLQSAAAVVLAIGTISGGALAVDQRYAREIRVVQMEQSFVRGQLNSQRIVLEQELFAWRSTEATRKLTPMEFQRKSTVERELALIYEQLKRMR